MTTKRLTRLQVDGLKNLADVDLEIPRLLAIGGPNGAGKTALLQAIRLAVMGYEPELGRTLGATRQLASNGDPIEIALHYDTGFTVRRTIGASMEIEVTPPTDERTLADFQVRIDRETGAFVPSFDLDAFLALSSEKRKEYLFGLLPRSLADLDEALFRRWLGYAEAEAPLKKAIDKLWVEYVIEESSPIDGLASAIDFAHDRWLEAERERQAQAKVVQAADRDAAAASTEVDEDPERLDELQAELEVVTRKLGEFTEQQREAERAAKRARERDHQIRVVGTRLEEAATKAEEVDRELAEITLPTDVEVADANSTHEELEARVARLQQQSQDLTVKRAKRAGPLGKAKAQLTELEGHDRCPVCHSVADLEQVRQDLRDAIAGDQADLDDIQADIEATVSELATARREAGEAAQVVARIGEARVAHQRLTERRAGLDREIESLREERGRLEAQEVDRVEPPDPDVERELTSRSAYLREEIRSEQEKARAAGKAEAERERATRERAKYERLERRAESLKALHGDLQKLRAHVIEQMVGPVASTANELLQTIDPAKTFRFVFEREGRAEFDFGFEEDGVFRSYDAASTGEDAFLAVVLVAALIAACEPAWPVLLVDNVESVDEGRRADLMRALAAMADRFGNVVLAGCCPFPEIAGWDHLLANGEPREAVAA